MARAAIWAGVVVAALSGCGTVHNFCGDHSDTPACAVFGGVRSDVRVGVQYLHFDPAKDHGDFPLKDCSDPAVQFYAKTIGWYMLTLDLPLCVVTDTVTLPYTLLSQLVGKDAPPETAHKPSPRGNGQSSQPAEGSANAAKAGDSP